MNPGRKTRGRGLYLCLLVLGALAVPTAAQAFLPPAPPTGNGPYFPMRAKARFGDGIGASRGHEGQDLFAPAGTPELAVEDAVVVDAARGDNGGRGNFVSIYSPEANRTYNYFHMLHAPVVRKGQHVIAGQMLGELGCTGSCWGNHLHFEMRQGRDEYGPVLDPAPFLRTLVPPPPRLTPYFGAGW